MSSIVWDFFERPENLRAEFVTCSKCQAVLAYKGTTSGMMKHMKARHSADYQRSLEQRGVVFPSGAPMSFSSRITTQPQHPEFLLARSFLSGRIPLNFADNQEFIQYCKAINPNFKVPNSLKMRQIIEENILSHLEMVKFQVRDVESFVIITDGLSLSKIDTDSIFSVHVAFVNPVNFERKALLAGISHLETEPKPEILKKIEQIVENIGLKMENCQGTVCGVDSGFEGLESVPCSGDVINRIFEEFAEKVETVAEFKEKIMEIVEILEDNKYNGNDPDKHLVFSLPSEQWGSLYNWLKFYEGNILYLQALPCLNGKLIENEKWPELSKIILLLQPLHNALIDLTRGNAFYSDIVPSLLCVKEELDENDPMANVLAELIQRKISDYLSNDQILLAMLSDPRYSYIPNLIDPKTWHEAEKLLSQQEGPSGLSPEYPKRPKLEEDAPKTSGIAGLLKRKIKNECSKKDLTSEILHYEALMATNRPDYNSDPLQFWKEQRHNFPIMAKCSRKILAASASTSQTEKLSRKCLSIIEKNKTNIAQRDLNMYLFGLALVPETATNAISKEEANTTQQINRNIPMEFLLSAPNLMEMSREIKAEPSEEPHNPINYNYPIFSEYQ